MPEESVNLESATVQPQSTQLRDGSSLYYALLYTTEDQRRAIIQLLTLCKTLANTLLDVHEASVAEQKIHWWHEEITRLYNAKPRHPVTRGAQSFIQQHQIDQAGLLAILEANNSEKFINAATAQEFNERLLKDYGSRLRICLKVADVSGGATNEDDRWIKPLALGLGRIDRLARMRELHHRGYPALPDSAYSNASLDPTHLLSPDHDDARNSLLQTQIALAKGECESAMAEPVLKEGQARLPFQILARLRAAQMSKWQAHKFEPVDAYMALTPLSKAWHAWRTKRKQSM